MGDSGPGPGWDGAWRDALDDLELEVECAEGLLRASAPAQVAAPLPSWRPRELGPLPGDLRERAADLLARQLAAAEALARAMVGTRRHVELLDRIEDGDDGGRPAYVDRTG